MGIPFQNGFIQLPTPLARRNMLLHLRCEAFRLLGHAAEVEHLDAASCAPLGFRSKVLGLNVVTALFCHSTYAPVPND